jgi:hypothetical protein
MMSYSPIPGESATVLELASEQEWRRDIPLPTTGQLCDKVRWTTEGYTEKLLGAQCS